MSPLHCVIFLVLVFGVRAILPEDVVHGRRSIVRFKYHQRFEELGTGPHFETFHRARLFGTLQRHGLSPREIWPGSMLAVSHTDDGVIESLTDRLMEETDGGVEILSIDPDLPITVHDFAGDAESLGIPSSTQFPDRPVHPHTVSQTASGHHADPPVHVHSPGTNSPTTKRGSSVLHPLYVRPISSSTTPVYWHLDLLDSLDFSLDGRYSTTTLGGVTGSVGGAAPDVWVIDTGVKTTLTDFGGRANFYADVLGQGVVTDLDGHGTKVASLITSATFGNTLSNVYSVRVLQGDTGYTSDVIEGLYTVLNAATGRRKVVSMSIGGAPNAALDAAVISLLNAGIAVVVSAGNDADSACNYSPGRVPGVITVSAHDINGDIPFFSNTGTCVDIYAAGSNVKTLGLDGSVSITSGTSMSAPIVAGILSLIAGQHPTATITEWRQTMLEFAVACGADSDLLCVRTPYRAPNELVGLPDIGTDSSSFALDMDMFLLFALWCTVLLAIVDSSFFASVY